MKNPKVIAAIILTAAVAFFASCSTQTPKSDLPFDEYPRCTRCDEPTPEEYVYQAEGDFHCPNCAYRLIQEMESDECKKCYKCNTFYWSDNSESECGLCAACKESRIAECYFCGEPTLAWSNQSRFSVCNKCLYAAYKNGALKKFLIDFFDSY